jgi:DNA-binding transcriptional LysR family regulator
LDTLESMRVFVRVVETGGFAAAARSLHLSPAMVTKHVAHLEARTGARLLNRTTRQVHTTAVGQAYFERCVTILAGVEDAETEAGAEAAAPRGTLRITAPVEFGNDHLSAVAAEFLSRHPEVDLVLDFSNRRIDLVQEGYDLAIRVAREMDTALAGRRLASSRFHVVASPSHVARNGRPATPEDLAGHPCLVFGFPAPWTSWSFQRDGRATTVRVTPRVTATSSAALLQAACAGVGISLLPSFVCGAALARGELVSLFPEFDLGVLGVYALFPHRTLLPVRVRLFMDLLVERFGRDADADPWLPA